MARVGEPFLEQGRGGSEDEDGKAYSFGEDEQDPQGGTAMLKRAVLVGTDGERESKRPEQQNKQVEQRLEPAKMLKAKMGVSVAHQKHRLEKHHDCVPHRGRASEQWKQQFSNERLHRKQQSRAQENRDSKGCGQKGVLLLANWALSLHLR